MSETFSRRNVLTQIATAAAAAASVSSASAQHVHEAMARNLNEVGPQPPKAFTEHETKTLRLLCETIVPGASQGGAFEYIDLLSNHNDVLKAIYTGGILWLDHKMEQRVGSAWVDAKPEDQKAMLDIIAFRMNEETYGPGVRFFDWARRMTVDAYYTSAAGIKELGYKGNTAVAEFTVPADAIEYALKRSGLG
ncbi:MAG TPA: gluconate 2-dehydrogenase subunit 3 family protein [Bryobacteraceae bacterium]